MPWLPEEEEYYRKKKRKNTLGFYAMGEKLTEEEYRRRLLNIAKKQADAAVRHANYALGMLIVTIIGLGLTALSLWLQHSKMEQVEQELKGVKEDIKNIRRRLREIAYEVEEETAEYFEETTR